MVNTVGRTRVIERVKYPKRQRRMANTKEQLKVKEREKTYIEERQTEKNDKHRWTGKSNRKRSKIEQRQTEKNGKHRWTGESN